MKIVVKKELKVIDVRADGREVFSEEYHAEPDEELTQFLKTVDTFLRMVIHGRLPIIRVSR